jgi:hypothetical protein
MTKLLPFKEERKAIWCSQYLICFTTALKRMVCTQTLYQNEGVRGKAQNFRIELS